MKYYPKNYYAKNADKIRSALRKLYASNPESWKRAVSKWCAANPGTQKRKNRMWYSKYCSAVLQKRKHDYNASITCKRAARLLHHAVHRCRENAKNKLYHNEKKIRASIANKTAKRARYVITEPNLDVQERYVQNMKKKISSKPTLKQMLFRAFKRNRKPSNVVSNIAARKLLHRVLKARKQSVGKLLNCIRSVNMLKINSEDFGKSRHTAFSEPFFYDQSYTMVRPIAVDSHGRCVIAEEEGERNEETNRPKWWKCTAECKLPTSLEMQSSMTTKSLFEQPVHKLREDLNSIDQCSEHGHYSRPLAGHPLPCTSDCQSSLRALRAAATHFPQLRRFLHLLYEGIRQHRLLESIDTALCTGDFEKLSKLCAISYCKLLSSKGSSDDSCGAVDSVDAVDQPIRLQQHKLPDLESHLHVEHAEVIADIGILFIMMQNFPIAAASGFFRGNKLLRLNSVIKSFAPTYGQN